VRIPCLSALALVTLLPQDVWGQALKSGDRLRVTFALGGPRIEATFLSYDADSLRFAPRDTALLSRHALAFTEIQVLQAYRGRRPATGRGALIGALAGAAVGAVLVSANPGECEPAFSCAAFGAVVVGGGGLVLGAILGAVLGHDHWERLTIPLRP